MWAPGAGVTDDIGKVAGFRLERAPMADGLPVMALSNSGDPLMAGVRNLLLASYMPHGMGPVWKVSDPDAVILGSYFGTNLPGMAVKRYDSHTEIFIGQGGCVTPELARNIAKEAGAHCWIDTGDPAASAGNLLIVSAASSGKKEIFLPPDVVSAECLTGQRIVKEGRSVKCELKYGDVLVLDLTYRN